MRRGDQAAAIEAGIVDKLPLVVLFFLVEQPNRIFLDEAGYADDRTAGDQLLAAGTGISISLRRAGRALSSGLSGICSSGRSCPRLICG